jgi:hypothetical protein
LVNNIILGKVFLLHYSFDVNAMLAKLTSKNQLTLPKSIVTSIPKTDYFEVEVENGRIMLTPVRMQQADAVRAKLDALGISDQDVLDAIQWARKSQP